VLCSVLRDSVIVAFCTFFNNDSIREVYNIPVTTGSSGGLTQPLQIEIWNTAISGGFIKFSECQVPLRKWKPPIVKTFWRRFWFESHMLSRGCLVATCVRFLAVWKRNRRANPEPTCCNNLGAFYLTCFARVCEIFTSVVSESQCGPIVVL